MGSWSIERSCPRRPARPVVELLEVANPFLFGPFLLWLGLCLVGGSAWAQDEAEKPPAAAAENRVGRTGADPDADHR